MARSSDVVVVGGGIMGACSALALARRGRRVELIERRHPAAGSSGKSGAILRQHYVERPLVRLARQGLNFYGSFAERFGEDIGFRRHGMILIAPTSRARELDTAIAMQREEGVPVRRVDEYELAQLEPRGFYEREIVACHEADAASADPRRSVEAILDLAARFGARLSFGEELLGIERAGERVRAVRTNLGEIACDQLLLAAGPWSGALLAAAGAPLPLTVVRPEQAFLEAPARFGAPAPVFVDLPLGAYWKPERISMIRVGSVAIAGDQRVEDPDDYDETASAAFCALSRERVARRLPALADATNWGGCAALYTMSPDERPVLGPHPALEGLFVMAGFSGHGFKLAPPLGESLANWMCDGAPKLFDAATFGVERLSTAMRKGSLGLYED